MQNLNVVFKFWSMFFVESIILGPYCEADLQSTDWNAEFPFCRKKISRGFLWECGGKLDTEITCETNKSRKMEIFSVFLNLNSWFFWENCFGYFLLFFQNPVCRPDRAEPCCQVAAKQTGKVCFSVCNNLPGEAVFRAVDHTNVDSGVGS